jgi:hypothetical protein
MLPEFYIFKKQTRGSARWLEVVSDLEAAKLRVQELAEPVPGDFYQVRPPRLEDRPLLNIAASNS